MPTFETRSLGRCLQSAKPQGWAGCLVLGVGVYVLLHALAIATNWGGLELKPAIASASFVPPTIVTIILSWRIAGSAAFHVRLRWAWFLFGLACASAITGYLMVAYSAAFV